MKSPGKPVAFAILTVLGMLAASGVGCSSGSSSSSESTSDPFASTTSAELVCKVSATQTDGTVYYREERQPIHAIRNKLKYFPAFASAIGIQSVSDCAGVRAFQKAYETYAGQHPGFDAYEPVEFEGDALPIPQTRPQVRTPKIVNGVAQAFSPVVRLTWSEGGSGGFGIKIVHHCTGTFIAKNWILTAAHCLKNTVGDGYNSYVIDWGDASGTPIPPNAPFGTFGTNVQKELETRVIEVPDPRSVGSISDFDVALLYLNGTYHDDFLPPDPNIGSAMMMSLLPPNVGDIATAVGFGPDIPTSAGPQFPRDFNLRVATTTPIASVGPTLISIISNPDNGEFAMCQGDSGGPLFEHTSLGNAIFGIDHSVDSIIPFSDVPQCGAGSQVTQKWARADLEISFIEKAMRRYIGTSVALDGGPAGATFPQFACQRLGGVNNPIVAQCWGLACKTELDCPLLLTAPQQQYMCVGGTNEVNFDQTSFGISGCFTCGGQNCDCIVGQCIPGPVAPPQADAAIH